MKEISGKNLILILLSIITLITAIFGGGGYTAAFAATSYSGVLQDLQKDETFNPENYPEKRTDYSIKVIQVAESTDGEVLIYTYQPCQTNIYLVATSINMSRTESVKDTRLYQLELLNSNGVFCKYKVKGVQTNVLSQGVRCYNISSIYRAWDRYMDAVPIGGNKVSEVSFPVGQIWRVETVNGYVLYEHVDTEVIRITDKLVGFLRYDDGIAWLDFENKDSHFIAFSTDKRMDKLRSAKVSFVRQSYTSTVVSGTDLGKEVEDEVTVKYSDVVRSTNDNISSTKYEWNRIQSAKEFVATEKLEDETKESVEKMDWVLRFYETDYSTPGGGTALLGALFSVWIWAGMALFGESSGTIVSDVSILELEFETDGKVYALGAVDNKQTGTQDPVGGDYVGKDGVPWWFWLILAIVVIIALCIIGIFVKPVATVLLWIAKALFRVISLPFRGIAALVKKRQEKNNDNGSDKP